MATIQRLWSTKHRLRILAIIFGVSMIYVLPFLAIPGMAAIYLKIDGIDGDATDEAHPKWIELDSISWNTSRAISTSVGGSREASAPSFTDVSVVKRMDLSSAPLFFEAVTGKQGKTATIHLTKNVGGTPVTYYEMTLSDILVSSFSQGTSNGGDAPTESISLNFSKIGVKYTPYNTGKAGTPISYSYDLATGKTQ